MRKLFSFLLLILIISSEALAALPRADIAFLWDSEPIRLGQDVVAETEIKIKLPDGFYLNAEMTDLEFTAIGKIKIIKVAYPAKTKMPAPPGGQFIDAYMPDSGIKIEMEAPQNLDDGQYDLRAILHYQACSEKGCLNPVDKVITWKVEVGDTSVAEAYDGRSLTQRGFVDLILGKSSGKVLNISINWLFLIAFLGGVMSGFTPCVLPLIPITLLIIGVNPKGNWKGNFALSVSLVVGMALTYALFAIFATALGKSFGFIFQNRVFIFFVVVFLFLMSLSLMGFYTFEIPKTLREFLNKLSGDGLRGAFFSGASMGLLATPCIGPILGVLTLYAASARSLTVSFALFMSYALGLGLIFVIVGTWYGTFAGHLKKARLHWAKKFVGFLLLIPALYYLNTVIPFTHFFVERSPVPIKWQPAQKAFDLSANTGSKPLLLFFTAAWCPPCKIMDAYIFRNKEIVNLSEKFHSIKVNTTTWKPENEILLRRYDVKGWPTVIFASPDGNFYKDLSFEGGYITIGVLKDAMQKALSRSGGGSG